MREGAREVNLGYEDAGTREGCAGHFDCALQVTHGGRFGLVRPVVESEGQHDLEDVRGDRGFTQDGSSVRESGPGEALDLEARPNERREAGQVRVAQNEVYFSCLQGPLGVLTGGVGVTSRPPGGLGLGLGLGLRAIYHF